MTTPTPSEAQAFAILAGNVTYTPPKPKRRKTVSELQASAIESGSDTWDTDDMNV